MPPAIDQPAEHFYHEDQVPQEHYNWRTSPYWNKPENDEPYEEVPNSREGSKRRAAIAAASDITKSVRGIPQVEGSYKTPLTSAETTLNEEKEESGSRSSTSTIDRQGCSLPSLQWDTDPERILQDLFSTSSTDDFYATNPRNTQVSEWSHWQGFPLPTISRIRLVHCRSRQNV